MNRIYDPATLLESLPHRFENVVLDRMERWEEDGMPAGAGELTIRAGDPAGRDLFLVRGPGGPVYYPYILIEFYALSAIILMEEKVRAGLTAVFSQIRKVEMTGTVPAGAAIRGTVRLKSITSGFYRFQGAMSADGRDFASLEIMAYGVDFKQAAPSREGDMKKVPVPPAMNEGPVDRSLFAFKDPGLVFADRIHSVDAANRRLVTAFTYPPTHRLTRGHFPGNPIMMGVCQVAMVSDAVQLAAAAFGGTGRVQADAEIMRTDGTLVCEVKGLQLDIASPGALPALAAVRGVAFRDLVRPGTGLFCAVTLV
ncbi:MAG: hypothetical protein ABIF71_04845 [Planctomycetota bacterium]